MGQKTKAKIIENDFSVQNIMQDAKLFDIILFSNKMGFNTSTPIRMGTLSRWNHAALIVDQPPVKQQRTGCPLYVYEYAANGQQVTSQQLANKLKDTSLTQVALLRFNDLQKIASPASQKKATSIIIKDFLHRKGIFAEKLKTTPAVRKKHRYDLFSIFYIAFMVLAILTSVAVIALSFATLLFNQLLPVLGGGLWFLLFSATIWKGCHIYYGKTSKKRGRFNAICSTYPVGVLKNIIYDPQTQKTELDEFEDKWLNGTPPSPGSLFNHARSSENCNLYLYKKK